MMQIPPPSQLSLLTSMFGSENETKDRKGEKRETSNGIPMPEAREELSSNYRQQQHSSLLGGNGSSLATRNLPVLRPQSHSKQQLRVKLPPEDQQKLQPKKMTRRKSPSQKIPRSNNNTHSNMYSNASYSTSIPNNRFEKDENGNPKLQPHTCFSYRTMEKQYEKDTLRMLERIQKSRSFEQQQRNQEGTHQAASTTRSSSLKDLVDYQLHYDSGFYIGNEDDEWDDYGHFNNTNEIHHEINHQDGHLLFEEEEEIFELDL